MQYEKYENVIAPSDKLEFQFTSEGPNGKIKKVVQFTKTDNEEIYNLAFGNLNVNGSIDDEAVNNNKDRNKILATVTETVFDFTKMYPQCFVFFTRSTKERTRLYRMALSLNYNYLVEVFYLFGLTEEGIPEKFIHQKNYNGFLIKKK